jgi:hypothetical protein
MKRYLLAASIFFVSAQSWAIGNLADISVYDRYQGRNLPVYEHDGRYYVIGKPGNRYQIHMRNQSDQDLLAVTSVDGVNVVSGETAGWQQSGYVLEPYRLTDVKGWRKSMSHIAQFYFTSLADSYAARTSRPDNVGVIGVALFRSRVVNPPPVAYSEENESRERDARAADKSQAEAQSAPSSREGSGAAAPVPTKPRAEKKLGTGHGRKETSQTRYVEFERASETPDEVVTIYYDSYRNLVAQGVIPPNRSAQIPRPFPGQFVPDPQ